ncbi:hypothetical protein BH11ACT6_BH11ACT6_03680 [soil metagenome]
MTETPLIANTGSAPVITIARELRSAVEAADGVLPQRLVNLLDAATVLEAEPVQSDAADAILNTALAGDLNADKLSDLVVQAAQRQTQTDFRRSLRGRARRLIAERFDAELAAGGADEILDSLRAQFDEAAGLITVGVTKVNLNLEDSEFNKTATPDELAAYQALHRAVETLDSIALIPAKYFGIQGADNFRVLRRPPVYGAGQLSDEAIFTAAPGGRIIKQEFRPSGLRFSRWLRGGLRLNSIAEAQALLDEWLSERPDAPARVNPQEVGAVQLFDHVGRLIGYEMTARPD